MSTEELKEYLGIAVDMEESIFLQENLMTNIKAQIEKLKTSQKFTDPIAPVEPQYPTLPTHKKRHGVLGIIAGSIGLFCLGCVVGNLLGFGADDFDGLPLILAIITLLVAPVFCWIVYCVEDNKKHNTMYWNERNRLETAYQTSMQNYRIQVTTYQDTLIKNQWKRQQDEAKRNTKTIFLQGQQEELEKSLSESRSCLQKIYEKNIIFPKYRNLVMVCSLYEYICAGRCTELEGHEGAYNILETEIRLDRIISQLNLVVSNLEQIKRNQFMLYSAVQESNQRLSQITGAIGDMSASLDDIYNSTSQLSENAAQLSTHIIELQKNSALTAYHTERAQKELAYMNRMDYLAGRNDDVFWNHPPV